MLNRILKFLKYYKKGNQQTENKQIKLLNNCSYQLENMSKEEIDLVYKREMFLEVNGFIKISDYYYYPKLDFKLPIEKIKNLKYKDLEKVISDILDQLNYLDKYKKKVFDNCINYIELYVDKKDYKNNTES